MTQHPPAHAMASFGTPVGALGIFAQLGAAVARHRSRNAEYRRIRRELESYTDRQLHDLGLSRFDIDDVARGHFRR